MRDSARPSMRSSADPGGRPHDAPLPRRGRAGAASRRLVAMRRLGVLVRTEPRVERRDPSRMASDVAERLRGQATSCARFRSSGTRRLAPAQCARDVWRARRASPRARRAASSPRRARRAAAYASGRLCFSLIAFCASAKRLERGVERGRRRARFVEAIGLVVELREQSGARRRRRRRSRRTGSRRRHRAPRGGPLRRAGACRDRDRTRVETSPPRRRAAALDDGLVDRLAALVEQRVRAALRDALAAHDTRRARRRQPSERAADAQLGRLVHVRVERARVDAVEQPRDRAQRRALAGLVAPEDDMKPGRREIELEPAKRAVRHEVELRDPHRQPAAPSRVGDSRRRGRSVCSTSSTIARSVAASRQQDRAVPLAQLGGELLVELGEALAASSASSFGSSLMAARRRAR